MDFQALFSNLTHAVFDLFEIFRLERFFAIKVVEKSVLNHRADGDLGFRIQLFDCLRHQVSGTVSQSFEIVLFLVRITHLKNTCGSEPNERPFKTV